MATFAQGTHMSHALQINDLAGYQSYHSNPARRANP